MTRISLVLMLISITLGIQLETYAYNSAQFTWIDGPKKNDSLFINPSYGTRGVADKEEKKEESEEEEEKEVSPKKAKKSAKKASPAKKSKSEKRSRSASPAKKEKPAKKGRISTPRVLNILGKGKKEKKEESEDEKEESDAEEKVEKKEKKEKKDKSETEKKKKGPWVAPSLDLIRKGKFDTANEIRDEYNLPDLIAYSKKEVTIKIRSVTNNY
jgi:hypothetical protein